jgi:thiol-disulfide isomerase/thioredoxin
MNNIKLIFLIIITLSFEISFGQNTNCELTKSASEKIFIVDKDDIICLAKNSEKEKTLVYTFGIWCAPCIKHLPNAIQLARENNLDFYVLLMDKENSDKELNAIEFLKQIQEKINFEIKVINLKDENGRPNKKYKQFLAEITPPEFENINDMSKYIVIDKKGKVLMVTNWKDNREYDWEDDSIMIKERIIPILN